MRIRTYHTQINLDAIFGLHSRICSQINKNKQKKEEVSSETKENGPEIKINEKEHMKVLQEGNAKMTLKIEIERTDQHWRSRRGVVS